MTEAREKRWKVCFRSFYRVACRNIERYVENDRFRTFREQSQTEKENRRVLKRQASPLSFYSIFYNIRIINVTRTARHTVLTKGGRRIGLKFP